jgi:hypothetical protein
MESSSFRDILRGFLEEKEDVSPLKTSSFSSQKSNFAEAPPLLHWQGPHPKPIKKDAYSGQRTRDRKISPDNEEKKIPLPPQEKLIALTELAPQDQAHAKTLIQLGGIELANGISLLRVKKVHRRLAKALHPDRFEKGLSSGEMRQHRDQFLMLQSAYEKLSFSLRKSTNDSACGSESASAADCRRPAAA